jgi:hypothetical protein
MADKVSLCPRNRRSRPSSLAQVKERSQCGGASNVASFRSTIALLPPIRALILGRLPSLSESLGRQVRAIALVQTTYTNPVRTNSMAGLLTALERPVIVPLLHLTIWLSPLIWLFN